jgi:hypothetical protein
MKYCTECAEIFGLIKLSSQLFYQDCEICGKKCTTVHFRSERMEEWKLS